MKIEMGESLFYSWLRHVKECQIVQTNWKPSHSWHLHNEDEIRQLMKNIDDFFQNRYGYAVYKKNTFFQFLSQAEVDVLGFSTSGNHSKIYAVDVAFHENGLNYGSREETVMRVIKKFIRTVLCLIRYLDVKEGEIIFASPKIHNAVIKDLMPCVSDLTSLLHENKYYFTLRVIANDVFDDLVLKPTLVSIDEVCDTSELFMRSHQLTKMFGYELRRVNEHNTESKSDDLISTGRLSELKIGKVAQKHLKEALEGNTSDEEIAKMQTKEYSKKTFGIDFPLLVLVDGEYKKERYYVKPLNIRGTKYLLCSQWFEVPANNDRPFLMAWLEKHGMLKS